MKFNRIILLSLAATFLLALIPLWETFMNNVAIPFINAYFVKNSIFDCLFIISTLLVFIWGIYKTIKNEGIQVSFIDYSITAFLLGVWFYYRFINTQWVFISLYETQVSYLDIVILGLSLWIIFNRTYISLKNKKHSAKSDKELIINEAIKTAKEDLLNRSPFAENLVIHLNSLNVSEGARSIAVISSWGNGKTSFINLIVEIIENKYSADFDVIHFSPWHLAPSTSITKKFFQQIFHKYGNIDSQFASLIRKYYTLLEDSEFSYLSKVGKLLSYTTDSSTILKEITTKLKKSHKKILVIIDDVDRLNATEIEEIFRIIRGSANFPHFIFLSSFDKKYVQQALSENNHSKTKHYIEKFFEVEFNLPEYDMDILSKIILSKTKTFLTPEDYSNFSEYISDSSKIFNRPPVFAELSNLRNIYRWINNIRIRYEILIGECRIQDLADLELLNLLYPNVYDLLKHGYNTYLSCEQGHYRLWNNKMKKSDNDWYERLHPHKNLKEEDSYKEALAENDVVENILERLLPLHRFEPYPKAFSNPNYTKRYFYGILQHSEMSDEAFKVLIGKNFDEIKHELDKDVNALYANAIRLHIFYDSFKDEKHIKNILDIIFYAPLIHDYYGCDARTILRHLNSLNGEHEYRKTYLQKLLYKYGASMFVASHFCAYTYGRHDWEEYFTDNECDEIVVKMLYDAISENHKFSDIRDFYHKTIKYKRGAYNTLTQKCEDTPIYNPKADELLKQYMALNFQQILPSLIWQDHMHQEKRYYPSNDFMHFWDNFESFEEYCQQQNIDFFSGIDKSVLLEFKSFLDNYLANEKESIPYVFNVIKLN